MSMTVRELMGKLSQYRPDAEVRVFTGADGLFIDGVVGLLDLKDLNSRTMGFNSAEESRDYFERLDGFIESEKELCTEGSVYLTTYLY